MAINQNELPKATITDAVLPSGHPKNDSKDNKVIQSDKEETTFLNGAEILQKSGKELERGDFIIPRRIQQNYTEINGKFFTKDTNRVIFEDTGKKLATSTTNKEAIADMVIYAKAKQWEHLKLTGSQEFRREAWLQAESQGIKTQGYTPKEKDLAELETLRQERATNSIHPLQDQKSKSINEKIEERDNISAPRNDLNKDQAAMSVAMKTNVAEHLKVIQQLPGMEGKSFDQINRIAEMRALVAERDKLRPPSELSETLARFDKIATDPQFQKRIQQETIASIEDKTVERVQETDAREEELSL